MSKSNLPIGIFDSGVGGLTVVNAIRTFLPNESLIYFGDTAHLPYGDKSQQSIQHHSIKIAEFLLEQSCKLLVIACNTASAFAYDAVQQHLSEQGIKIVVVDVINPVIDELKQNTAIKKIGVIGTKGTIESGTYQKKIGSLEKEWEIVGLATPLFAPMIEEGFIYDDISNAIIRAYLSNESLAGIDSLILGCTHYPIIKNQIRKFFNFSVVIVDSAQIVAMHLIKMLGELNLLATSKDRADRFFVSDYTASFNQIASMFLENDIKLERAMIW